MTNEPKIYLSIDFSSIKPINIYIIAGIFIAEASASTKPIPIDNLNFLLFSSPENLKNFAKISNILFSLLYCILYRNVGIPHIFIKYT